jgi:hypothetical protein
MSFAEALDIAMHPTRLWDMLAHKGSGISAGTASRGLISQLTEGQRARICEYDGPLASGNSDLPKLKNRSRKAA